jgi:hypothetical protein
MTQKPYTKRTLYGVRHYPAGERFSRHVGHKGRLVPRNAAARIARRLKRAGIDAFVHPYTIHVTPEQNARLNARYA